MARQIGQKISPQKIGAIATTDKGAANGIATLGADGKIPATQARSSSLAYNAATGILTLTDASNATSTIDLPIENLLQTPSYNPGTQALTFTTNGGNAIVLSLSDLANLPEIFIATVDPSTTPGDGQKIYFRSDNGNYWINSGSAWTGPFLAFSQAEKTKLAGIASNATANATTDDLAEGTSNLYFSVVRARAAFTAGTNVSIDNGVISAVGGGGGGSTSVTGGNTIVAANVASMKSLTGLTDNSLVRLLGYYSTRDGGEGIFLYSSSSTATANEGTIFAPNTGGGRFLRLDTNGISNVRWFGAKGDAATDDTTAIRRAVQYGQELANITDSRKVYFPKGQYVVMGNSMFAPLARQWGSKIGVTFEGEYLATEILLRPQGTDVLWLFDNDEANTPDYYGCQIKNFYFRGDSTKRSQCNGFKWNPFDGSTSGSAGSDKWITSHVFIDDFNECFRGNGAVLAGEMRFEHLKINKSTTAFVWNNQQAVNWNVNNCDICVNTYFKVETKAGGALGVTGGSWSTSFGQATILQIENTNGLGTSHFFNFRDVRVELINTGDKLVDVTVGATSGVCNINWVNCSFLKTYNAAAGAAFTWVAIDRNTSLTFEGCSIDSGLLYTVNKSTFQSAGAHSYGDIFFHRCYIPRDLSTSFTFTNNLGKVSARDCLGHKGTTVQAENQALDFDLNWSGGVGNNNTSIALKRAVIFNPLQLPFPENGSSERYILMPKGAKIKNIYVLKPAGVGNTNVYQLNVGNSDKSVTYGSSTSGAANLKHYIAVERTMDNLIDTDATNAGQVRLWATGGAAANMKSAAAFAIVEYY